MVIKSLTELRNFKKNPQQNNSETATNENDKEIPEERYISPEERQKIIGDPKLIQ